MTLSVLYNLEVEQAVLGALIGDSSGENWSRVCEILRPEHFWEPLHARIYDAATSLLSAGKPASQLVLKSYLADDPALKDLGGIEYLSRLIGCAATSMALPSHSELLADLAMRRLVIAAAQDLIASSEQVEVNRSVRGVVASHLDVVQGLLDRRGERKTTFTLGEASAATVQRILRVHAGEVDQDAVLTRFHSLDQLTGGLHRGEFIVLGGRPSMGKTALAVQLAYNIARHGGGVFYASLEMPVALLTPRFLSGHLHLPCCEHQIDYQRILQGKVTELQMGQVAAASEELRSWPLVIDDAPALSPAELEARAQLAKVRMKRHGKSLDLVLVDHIHKMRQPGALRKTDEYTEISSRLAEMAKRLNCPVMALAQLNRGVEGREDKRPQLSDLRESGSIEQDADMVMFVFRPAYYLARKRHDDPAAQARVLRELSRTEHHLEVQIAKQRSGPTGTLDLWCDLPANVVLDSDVIAADQGRAA